MATILLVDDDTKFLLALQLLLEGEGYRVLIAVDGEDATANVATQRPDLVVTDWMMPHVDGVAFSRQLKVDPATSSIPVVMLSAALLPCPAEPLWNIFMRKPVPPRRLLEVIASLLNERLTVAARGADIGKEPPATDAHLTQCPDPTA